MDDTTKQLAHTDADRARPEAEEPVINDPSDDIDYDEIHASTQPDHEAGRLAFDGTLYPTDEAARLAHRAFLQSVLDEVLRGIAARNPLETPS